MTRDEYKQASRDELEAVIDRFAEIEQAVDLQPGSLVADLLAWFATESDPEEIIGYIEGSYELKEVPDDWQERVRNIREAIAA